MTALSRVCVLLYIVKGNMSAMGCAGNFRFPQLGCDILVWAHCFHIVDAYCRTLRRMENLEEAEAEAAGETGMLQGAIMGLFGI